MNEFLIKNYIKKLTINDIITFLNKNNLKLSKEEAEIILKYIKKDYHTIIYGNPKPILNELKTKINNTNYQKIEQLYIEYKNKYQNYL